MAVITSVIFSSCDEHILEHNSLQVGMIYCTDGDVLSPAAFEASGKKAKAVVFHVVKEGTVPVLGYAVSLHDSPAVSWLYESEDSATRKEGSQGTSCDIEAMDGDINTYNIRQSSLYAPLLDFLSSDFYIPSVAQMNALSISLSVVNPIISSLGGDEVSMNDDAWYWTSTEVEGMDSNMAWKYSPGIGQQLASSKWSEYHTRPILTVSRYPY